MHHASASVAVVLTRCRLYLQFWSEMLYRNLAVPLQVVAVGVRALSWERIGRLPIRIGSVLIVQHNSQQHPLKQQPARVQQIA